MRIWLFFFALLAAIASAAAIQITPDGVFDCSALGTTQIAEGDGSLQSLFDACASDPLCARRTGIEGGGTIFTFEQTLAQAQPFGPGVLTLEAPALYYLCGKTVQEALYAMYVDRTTVSSFRVITCPIDHVYVPTKDRCRPSLLHSQNDTYLQIVAYLCYGLVAVILGFLAVRTCVRKPMFRAEK